MSRHLICDSCHSVIYEDKKYESHPNYVALELAIANRYNDAYKLSLHLCKGCDMKVAKALLPILPNIAGYIEPNVFVKEDEE